MEMMSHKKPSYTRWNSIRDSWVGLYMLDDNEYGQRRAITDIPRVLVYKCSTMKLIECNVMKCIQILCSVIMFYLQITAIAESTSKFIYK